MWIDEKWRVPLSPTQIPLKEQSLESQGMPAAGKIEGFWRFSLALDA
jgi:hypothetical protein